MCDDTVTYHDENTLAKVYAAFDEASISERRALEVINCVMNKGVYFREKDPKAEPEDSDVISLDLRTSPSIQQYRLKPPVVEAMEVRLESLSHILSFFLGRREVSFTIEYIGRNANIQIDQGENLPKLEARFGDFLVREGYGDGEFVHVVDAITFTRTYELDERGPR